MPEKGGREDERGGEDGFFFGLVGKTKADLTAKQLPLLRVIELDAQPNSKISGSRKIAIKDHEGYGINGKNAFETLGQVGISSRVKGLLLLNLVMIACSSTFVVLKDGQKNIDPFIFSTVRFLLAALAFSPFLGKAMQQPKVHLPGLEVGFWAAGGYLTQSVSLLTTDASRGAFLSAFTVVVVPLLEGTFGSNKIKRAHWIAAVMSLVGVMLIEDSGTPASWGDFWSFASAVLFGVQIFRTEHWSKRLGSNAFMPMISISIAFIALLSIVGAIFTNPVELVSLFMRPFSDLSESVSLPWVEILYMAFFVTNFGLWAEVIALQYINSTEAAIVYTLEPVFGAGFAWLFLGEHFGGWVGWLGAILVTVSQLVSFVLPK